MKSKTLMPERLIQRRFDLSGWLWHFVRRDNEPKTTLETIIKNCSLEGTICRPFQEKVICFSETPLFSHIQQDVDLREFEYKRLSLYGLGFHRKYLYDIGARPVIYNEKSNYAALPEELKHLFVEFNLSCGVDFTWQREWRLKADLLQLDKKNVVLVFPDHNEFSNLLYGYFADATFEDGGDLMLCAGYDKLWNFIPLDFCESFSYDDITGYIDTDFFDDLKSITYDVL